MTRACTLPILHPESGTRIGTLARVGEFHLRESVVAEILTRWRNAAGDWFLTTFEANPARTRRWLRKAVVESESRVLYLIHDHSGRAIGQIGFVLAANGAAELDNGIRGERGGHPRLYQAAEIALLDWLFDEGIERVFARVIRDNVSALRLHRSVGFTISDERLPLRRVARHRESALVPFEPGDGGEPDAHLCTLTLDRAAFDARWSGPEEIDHVA